MKLLLATGNVEVDFRYKDCRTPLLYASKSGHAAVVTQLLATSQREVDIEGMFGRTPLSHGSENGNKIAARLPIATGQNDVKSKYGHQIPLP